jgi:hypothetical protein
MQETMQEREREREREREMKREKTRQRTRSQERRAKSAGSRSAARLPLSTALAGTKFDVLIKCQSANFNRHRVTSQRSRAMFEKQSAGARMTDASDR